MSDMAAEDALVRRRGSSAVTTPRDADALEALEHLVAFSSRDWAQSQGDAWLYGIVAGWDDDADGPIDGPDGEPNAGMNDVAHRYGWDPPTVARLRALRAHWVSLRASNVADTAEG